MRRQTVTPGAADFLIITFNTFWQVKMDHKAYIGFVNAHAECDRRHNDLHIIADEGFLILSAISIFKPSMIRADRLFIACQCRGEFVHLFAREAVDDSRLVFEILKEF